MTMDPILLARLQKEILEGCETPPSRDKPLRTAIEMFLDKETPYRKGYSHDDVIDAVIQAVSFPNLTLSSVANMSRQTDDPESKDKMSRTRLYARFPQELDVASITESFGQLNAELAATHVKEFGVKECTIAVDEFITGPAASKCRYRGDKKATTDAGNRMIPNKVGREVLSIGKQNRKGKASEKIGSFTLQSLLGREYFMSAVNVEGYRYTLSITIPETLKNSSEQVLQTGSCGVESFKELCPELQTAFTVDARWSTNESIAAMIDAHQGTGVSWIVPGTLHGKRTPKSDSKQALRDQRNKVDDSQKSLYQLSVERFEDPNLVIPWLETDSKKARPNWFFSVDYDRPFLTSRPDIRCYRILCYYPLRDFLPGEECRYGTKNDNMGCKLFYSGGPPEFVFPERVMLPEEMAYVAKWVIRQYPERWFVERAIQFHKSTSVSAPSNGAMKWRVFRNNLWAFIVNLSNIYRRYDEDRGMVTKPLSAIYGLVGHALTFVFLHKASVEGSLELLLDRIEALEVFALAR